LNAASYEIRETITSYARIVIQRARRRADDKMVLLKRVASGGATPRDLRQFEFEHRILCKVSGPGVHASAALERNDGDALLVFDDFGGQLIPVGPKGVALDLFVEIACQLAAALGHIHGHGVVHNDIRTRNISMNPETRVVRLVNFQLASELSRERKDSSAAIVSAESLAYMSPEQTGRMNREVDYRTDYYSLGVTLFELATGQLPFQAADAIGWAHCHISRRPPLACEANLDVPARLSDIIGKLLAKDADDRYQSSRGLLADLERCRNEWRETRAVSRFPLGSHDVPERFEISHRLVGREREIATLLDAFQQASQGDATLLLVSGYSGIGKTSLIAEIHRPIVERRGYFVSGKFDQLDRSVPYAPIAHAFRGLLQQILAEPEDRLARWRGDLETALGPNRGLLVDLIPELESILAPGPPAPGALTGGEAQSRFKVAFRSFVGVFARPEHPLVLFLDDLQWADASTLDLLFDLVASGELKHLLVIGAYRDNEVHEGHLMSLVVRDIVAEREEAVRRLVLAPLDEGAVNQLVAATLHCGPAEAAPLTRVLLEKTGGNPFFVNELLTSFNSDGLFKFDAGRGGWTCDPGRLAQASVTANVADLLARRLRELPRDSMALLEAAACIGHEFDLATLATITDRDQDVAAAALWEPIRCGIVVPLDASYRLVGEPGNGRPTGFSVRYRFQHDRVQQAAYWLMVEEDRVAFHLKAGRLLRDSLGDATVRERLFEVVNHLNLGCAAIDDPAERHRLGLMNLHAARKAKRSTAYPIALRYFTNAAELMVETETGGPDGRFAAQQERAECAFLAGEIEQAEALCRHLVDEAPTRLERASVYSLLAMMLAHQAKMVDAIGAARSGLALLGVVLPEDPATIKAGISEGIGKMQGHLATVAVETLANLPEMTDPEQVMTMNLLFEVIPPAIQHDPPLFVLAELMMFDLALTHGVTAASCKNFVDCGIIQGGVLGNYDVAYRLGQTAFELLKRYSPTPLESAVRFVFGGWISHWRAHFSEGLAGLEESRRRGIEMGDLHHASYAVVFKVQRLPMVGTDLAICRAENQSAIAYLTRVRGASPLVGTLVATRAVAHLTDSDGGPEARDRADGEAVATLERGQNAQWLFGYAWTQAVTQFLLGDLEAAERWHRAAEPLLPGAPGVFGQPDHCLIGALLLTRRHRAGAPVSSAVLDSLAQAEAKLAHWAELSPGNFSHKHKLLRAERARLLDGRFDEVLLGYDEACLAAGQDFIHLRALARELQAEYCLDKGHAGLARAVMREAYHLYARWGARAKVARLEAQHPDWLLNAVDQTAEEDPAKPTSHDGALDLASVLKATQAVSGEVKSDRLYARLMETIIENAGAERGCLVLTADGDPALYVEARADIEATDRVTPHREPLESARNVSCEIVRYVARTKEPLVLNDAAAEGGFRGDAHLHAGGVKSVLCVPILRAGNRLGVVYLENNALRGAFTDSRLDVMRVIASQAAISIANARLYDSLERRVAERTAELAASRGQLQALIETVNAVPWEMDIATFQFTYVGPQGENLLGFPTHAWTAPGFFERRLHPDDTSRALEAVRGALESGQGQDIEFRLIGQNGRPVWVRNVLTVRDYAGNLVLRGMILDQTKRKQLEMELQQAQKLESVGRLASGIAHEINTPIQFVHDSVHFIREAMSDLAGVVTQYRQLCTALTGDPHWEPQAAALRRAEEAADVDYILENAPPAIERSLDGLGRVAAIVRSMKEFAHPDGGSQAPADINKAIENTLIIARNEYKYVAVLTSELGELPKVVCHLGELSQVVLNIVVNAAHAIADVVRGSGEKGGITVRTWRDADEAVIAIGDTGGGIPENVRDRIFDPFFTTKEVGRGTGQGLAIAHAVVVAKHGGTLTFETTIGVGTTFFVRLPVSGKPKAASPGGHPPPTSPPLVNPVLAGVPD
jgi:predicted ATPase/signal transduction histidine kinase